MVFVSIRLDTALAVFCKTPQQSKVKTRLQPLLGAIGATKAHQQLARKSLSTASASGASARYVFFTPNRRHGLFLYARAQGFMLVKQRGNDLGNKMFNAFKLGLQRHSALILMGTDCPALSPEHIQRVMAALELHDVVIIPATDGGYVLIAARRVDRCLFSNIHWGSATVLSSTIRALEALKWPYQLLPALPDLDTARDWRNARRHNWVKAIL